MSGNGKIVFNSVDMRTAYFSFLLASVFVCITAMNVFSAETIESMAAQVEKRLEAIDAVEFTFRVRSNTDMFPEMKETRQEYAFFRSKDPDYPRSWERWKVFYEKKPENWELDKFVVFNGKTIWTWDRLDHAHPGEFYKWSPGVIRAVVDPYVYMMGDEFVAANEFRDFLFLNIVGYGKSQIDDLARSNGFDKWEIVESALPNEYVLQRFIHHPSWENGYYGRTYLRLEPVPVVWRTEYAADFSDKAGKFDFYTVESFATFDEIYYPVRGRTVSYANANIAHDVIYEFEVESVRHLSEADKADWVPDWPTGTLVGDLAFGKDIEIPHTKEQLQERMDEYYAKLGVDREIKTQGRRNWIVLTLSIIGILLIILWLFLRFFTKIRSA